MNDVIGMAVSQRIQDLSQVMAARNITRCRMNVTYETCLLCEYI